MKLGDAQGERTRPVERRKARAAVQAEPDLGARSLRGPSQILSMACASWRVRQLAAGAVGVAADIGPGAESAGARIVDHAIGDAVVPRHRRQRPRRVAWLSFAAEIGAPTRSFIAIWPHICAVWNRVQ